MRKNGLKKLLETSQAVNAWLSIPSSYSSELVASCGFDAVTVDLQHGMIDFSQAVPMLQAISTTPATPLVRPSGSDPVEIMHLLDAGAYGVICPQVDDAEIARKVVAACKYPPQGSRSFGPARGLLYGGSDYFQHANDEILVFVMIESRAAVENLDAILDVKGIDGVYVGPNDLSLSYGEGPGSFPEGRVAEIIETIRAAARARGLATGIFCADGEMASQRLEQGFQLVTPGNDAGILKSNCLLQLEKIRGRKTRPGGEAY
ncbi:2,4-dihydroxyhept-2-ene-1,7-dioic acid aldolase [Alcaligenaceae bacterium]|nr:2,4-dihydroxyhept-2-ene-1,7-dioic acid aldolase [Alcaligenaceae bacterium]